MSQMSQKESQVIIFKYGRVLKSLSFEELNGVMNNLDRRVSILMNLMESRKVLIMSRRKSIKWVTNSSVSHKKCGRAIKSFKRVSRYLKKYEKILKVLIKIRNVSMKSERTL